MCIRDSSFSSGNITVDDVHQLLGTTDSGKLLDLMEALASRDACAALGILSEFWKGGAEPERLSEQILGIYRDLLSASVGCAANLMHYSQPQEFERVKQVAGRIGKHTLLASLEIMQEMLRRVQATTKVRILVETAIVRLASLEELDKIEEWLNILQSPPMKDFAKSGLVIAPSGSTQTNLVQKKNDIDSPDVTTAVSDVMEVSNTETVTSDSRPVGAKGTAVMSAQTMPGDRSPSCLLYTSPSPRDQRGSRMPSYA